jgi:hypothetical protein
MHEAERYGISRFEYLLRRYVHEFARALNHTQLPGSEQARVN